MNLWRKWKTSSATDKSLYYTVTQTLLSTDFRTIFVPRSLTVSHASRTTNIAFVSLMFTLLLMQWNENLCFLTRKHGFSEHHCTEQKSSRLWQYPFGADCENHKCQSHCGGQRISAWQQNNCSLYYPLPRSNTERNKGKVINKKQWRLNKEFSCIFPACP